MEELRIQKYLADCGICSRRAAERAIEEGDVKINGEIAEIIFIDDLSSFDTIGYQMRCHTRIVFLSFTVAVDLSQIDSVGLT